MVGKRSKPTGIASKLRQIEVLQRQGKPIADAVRQIDVPCRPTTNGRVIATSDYTSRSAINGQQRS
jgi:hypothetical protein